MVIVIGTPEHPLQVPPPWGGTVEYSLGGWFRCGRIANGYGSPSLAIQSSGLIILDKAQRLGHDPALSVDMRLIRRTLVRKYQDPS